MKTLFTKADYERLPEGFPAQLVEGWLVKEPSPIYRHQVVQARIHGCLLRLVGADLAPASPLDIVIDDHNVFWPDALVLRERPGPEDRCVGTPRLVFEILSPGTARRDRTVKRARYLAAGVEEVWIVDVEAGVVEVHAADGVRRATGGESLASRALPGLVIVPAEVLA